MSISGTFLPIALPLRGRALDAVLLLLLLLLLLEVLELAEGLVRSAARKSASMSSKSSAALASAALHFLLFFGILGGASVRREQWVLQSVVTCKGQE
jgi:ABC-type sulfate transport system permease component